VGEEQGFGQRQVGAAVDLDAAPEHAGAMAPSGSG
jgi:hypothetical protein